MSCGAVLLGRAAEYAVGAVDTVAPELLSRPTPCRKWNLRMLLSHLCSSVAALQEGLDSGRVCLFPTGDHETAADPTSLVRSRVTRLLDEWSVASDDRMIAVAGQPIPLSLMAGLAALEIAVHGWDVSRASGHDRPIPPDVAGELLTVARVVASDDNRHRLFAPPITTSAPASPGEELLAFLGRPAATARSQVARELGVNAGTPGYCCARATKLSRQRRDAGC